MEVKPYRFLTTCIFWAILLTCAECQWLSGENNHDEGSGWMCALWNTFTRLFEFEDYYTTSYSFSEQYKISQECCVRKLSYLSSIFTDLLKRIYLYGISRILLTLLMISVFLSAVITFWYPFTRPLGEDRFYDVFSFRHWRLPIGRGHFSRRIGRAGGREESPEFYDTDGSPSTSPSGIRDSQTVGESPEVLLSHADKHHDNREVVAEKSPKPEKEAHHQDILYFNSPARPSPPTVKIFNLHNPREIPNDIMDALLCLKTDCQHDHSKIRLIGPKIIVYPCLLSNQRNTQKDQTFGSFSREFKFCETKNSVATQTSSSEKTATLIIKTEAYVYEEDNLRQAGLISQGSMTGSLRIDRKDCNYTFNDNASANAARDTLSNVRESIAKSRLELSEFEGQLNYISLNFGNPLANSTKSTDFLDTPGQPNINEDRPLQATQADRNLVPFAADDIGHCSSTTLENEERGSFTTETQREESVVDQLKPTRGNVTLSRSMSYIGFDANLYERLSVLVAGYAIHKYRQSRSQTDVGRDERSSTVPHRLSRTV